MSMPSLVPAADRAPSLTSRIVTVHATDVTEGAPAPDAFVFSLTEALRVPADDVILRPGGVKVRLVDGRARVRLPVYTEKVQTVDGSTDWIILVTPSWGHGTSYPIRVPAGTSEISLADLPAVRPLTRREQQYAITGVGVTVTEGTQAGGSASYAHGPLDFQIQVPRFRPQTVYPYIDQTADARAEFYEARVRKDLDERLEEVTTAYELAVVQGFEGTLDEWLDSLVGPKGEDSEVPGPPNVLTVGEVTTGAAGSDAAATITGTSPEQVLGLTIPRGDKGEKGDKGDKSTVPGPTGKSAYQFAVDAGYEGTEEEFADAVLPDTIEWSQVESKPDEYPPETHTHTPEQVDGLADALAALTYDSGPQDWSGQLNSGWTGTVTALRTGHVVSVLVEGLTVESGGGNQAFVFPPGFTPAQNGLGAVRGRLTLYTAESVPSMRRCHVTSDSSSTRLVVTSAVVGERMYGTFFFQTTDPIPA